jgi:outer membrane protein assembly factor BamC
MTNHQANTPSLPRIRRSSTGMPLMGCALLLLAGCSALQEDKVDYTSAKRISTLEVPPDLTQLSRETRYAAPGSVVTASGYQVNAATPSRVTAANNVGDVRLERAGSQRWLVVSRPPEKLWEPIRDFWQENGFLIAQDQENLGLMETDWAENRAKIPQDFIRNTLGKVLESLYSTGERDKFRTRLERSAAGETEIYISHRGMIEVYADKNKDGTVWQPRPSDPELEAEFLRRMMAKLGLTKEQVTAQMAVEQQPPKSRLIEQGNTRLVQLDEPFDRAWRRVGLALDRTGFTVEDRDRSHGAYFVRYVEPVTETKEPGFLSRMFGGTKKEGKPAQYRIMVESQGNATTLAVLDAQGQPDSSPTAQRILKLLSDDLR